MLSFAQINGGKFRKEIRSFDIREAVKEVMMIQQNKADVMGISLDCEFFNFDSDSSFFLNTDKQRLQQVLLNF